MRAILLSMAAAAAQLSAQSVVSDAIGFNKVVCLSNSDTIVGVPFRVQGSQSSKLVAIPVVDGDSATLTVAAANLPSGALTAHYVKFSSGSMVGRFYDITGNTSTTITVNLNGDILSGVAIDDTLIIAEYWTLNALFPPAVATTDPATTGHAIVASTSTLPPGRRTEILLPNVAGIGVNLPAEGRYYIHAGIWKRSGSGASNQGGTVLYPNTLFTIRHSASVTQATVFKSIGEVETGWTSIPLTTQDAVAQDNFVAIPRPVAVTLEELNLRQSPGAFMASTSTLPGGRRDQLLIFDNEQQLINKAPSKTYYVNGGIWKLSGGGNDPRGADVIPSSAGFIIRKYKVAGHPTAFWDNAPSY